MLNIVRIPLSKEHLRAMPKEERALLFLLGYVANQITMVSKFIIFATNKTPTDETEQLVTGAQTQMLSRLAIGVVTEAWEMVRTRFLRSPMANDYLHRLNPTGQEALSSLKGHFGSSNLLPKLRNNYAFHYPNNDDLESGFEAAARDKEWDDKWNWYLEKNNFNSFYFVSDLVLIHSILSSIGETNLIVAQKKIMDEVKQASGLLTQFIGALNEAMLIKHLGSEMTAEICMMIKDAPSAHEVWIPFYVEIPAEETANSGNDQNVAAA